MNHKQQFTALLFLLICLPSSGFATYFGGESFYTPMMKMVEDATTIARVDITKHVDEEISALATILRSSTNQELIDQYLPTVDLYDRKNPHLFLFLDYNADRKSFEGNQGNLSIVTFKHKKLADSFEQRIREAIQYDLDQNEEKKADWIIEKLVPKGKKFNSYWEAPIISSEEELDGLWFYDATTSGKYLKKHALTAKQIDNIQQLTSMYKHGQLIQFGLQLDIPTIHAAGILTLFFMHRQVYSRSTILSLEKALFEADLPKPYRTELSKLLVYHLKSKLMNQSDIDINIHIHNSLSHLNQLLGNQEFHTLFEAWEISGHNVSMFALKTKPQIFEMIALASRKLNICQDQAILNLSNNSQLWDCPETFTPFDETGIEVHVSSNPSNGDFTIHVALENPDPIVVELLTFTENPIAQEQLNGKMNGIQNLFTKQFDLVDIPPGFYTLYIRQKNQVYIQKIVVK